MMETAKRRVAVRAYAEGGTNGQSTRVLRAVETTLCDTVKVDTRHYTFA